MGVYKGIKWCGLRESTLGSSPSHYGFWGCRGNLEDLKGEIGWGQPGVWGFFVIQTPRLLGNGDANEGSLQDSPLKLLQAPLRGSAHVLGVPDGEDGELCFAKARKLQTRCLKDEWS